MGLQALRNLGKSAIPIIEGRKVSPYKDIADLLVRVGPDKSAIESLAFCGALDEFGLSRNAIISNMDIILKFKKDLTKNDTWSDIPEIDEWYASLITLDIPTMPEMDRSVMLENEYTYSGMYITEHPLDQYGDAMEYFSHSDVSDLIIEKGDDDEEEEETVVFEERKVVVVGILKDVVQRMTKKGDKMAVAQCEDKTGSIKVTVFPRQLNECSIDFVENNVVVIEGTWKNDDFGSQIIVDHVTPIGEVLLPVDGTLFVMVDPDQVTATFENILDAYEGKGPKLCVRTPEKADNGKKKCYVYDPAGKRIISGDHTVVTPDVASVALTFSTFAAIKEMVKNIAIKNK